MILATSSSPHTKNNLSITAIMMWVAATLLPGLVALIHFFGWGYLINSLIAILIALVSEAFILKLRKRPVIKTLTDGSALLTGLFIGLSLPGYAPWWIPVVASLFAIIFIKQLYGGLGQNLFNPAMGAFALVLISFPLPMTTSWAAPQGLNGIERLDITQQIEITFGGSPDIFDGITMATPLDHYKTNIKNKTADELLKTDEFANGPLYGIFWVNLAFLFGGLLLIMKKIITWHAPAGVIAGVTIMSLIFSSDPDIHMPISLHLMGGATMLGAFFIATDPATTATSNKGKIIFGLGVGMFTYIIRTWGNFPDAIAFSILIMNFAAPFIDYYSRPRVYGKSGSMKGFALKDDYK